MVLTAIGATAQRYKSTLVLPILSGFLHHNIIQFSNASTTISISILPIDYTIFTMVGLIRDTLRSKSNSNGPSSNGNNSTEDNSRSSRLSRHTGRSGRILGGNTMITGRPRLLGGGIVGGVRSLMSGGSKSKGDDQQYADQQYDNNKFSDSDHNDPNALHRQADQHGDNYSSDNEHPSEYTKDDQHSPMSSRSG